MLCWQHVMIGTRCSWLHGDRRGFRNRDHRIHSSGDYKDRPPEDEHAGLRRYQEFHSGKPVDFDISVRVIVCREFVKKLIALDYRVIACSVGQRHQHFLTELVTDYHERRIVVGKCKQRASHAVRKILPGTIWAEGGEFTPISGKRHLRNSFNYIRNAKSPARSSGRTVLKRIGFSTKRDPSSSWDLLSSTSGCLVTPASEVLR